MQSTESHWKEELDGINRAINAAERSNLAEFDKLTAAMLLGLFHEAFHAYLENYVYPQRDHDVPRWLNEGLAQIFEAGNWSRARLRLDAPDAGRLEALQQDLRSAEQLSWPEF